MDAKIKEAWNKIHEIKIKMQYGGLDYDRAKELAEPHIVVINQKGLEIAKRLKQKWYPLTFAKAMR